MTLTAIDKATGFSICPEALCYQNGWLRQEVVSQLRSKSFLCPYCLLVGKSLEVSIVDTQGKRLFFRHKRWDNNADQCTGRKSDDHISTQVDFAAYLERQCEGVTTLEKRFPKTEYPQLSKDRIADIYLEDADGLKRVYEVQLAGINSDELAIRTADYKSIGLDVVWMLGKKALKEENRYWCEKELGGYIHLIFEEPNSDEVAA